MDSFVRQLFLVCISRPFPKLFIYLGFTLLLTKLLYQPEPTVRKGEREEKYIFLSVLFAFSPDSFLQCSRRAVSFNLYLKLIKSLIIIIFFFLAGIAFPEPSAGPNFTGFKREDAAAEEATGPGACLQIPEPRR